MSWAEEDYTRVGYTEWCRKSHIVWATMSGTEVWFRATLVRDAGGSEIIASIEGVPTLVRQLLDE